jgi:hypothetical protein
MPIDKASITTWHRLEPRPRSASIRRSLAAEVRDPLWMLGRQWQLGEFWGEDAGSPATVEVATSSSPMTAWQPQGASARPLTNTEPLEVTIGAEPVVLDLAQRVELGQVFESMLESTGTTQLLRQLRKELAIGPSDEDKLIALQDQELARFLRVCAGRAVDGAELYHRAPDLIANAPDPRLVAAIEEFVRFVELTCGKLLPEASSEPEAWQPPRLEYSAAVLATMPDGSQGLLSTDPNMDGGCAWYAFDRSPTTTTALGPIARPESRRWRLLPANVWFRGMPKARWWEFEDGNTDFGDIKPDKRDLARLALMDFMLIHSNDWYVFPLEMAVGSFCRVDDLLVHDVFGIVTRVQRADKGAGGAWTMFSTSIEGEKATFEDYFLLPPSAAVVTMSGPILEEVQFLRDELANMVWAIEHATEDGLGQPWPGHERVHTALGPATEEQGAQTDQESRLTLKYRIQSDVPAHWVPFFPTLVDAQRGQIALERGSSGEAVQPLALLLNPPDKPYRIMEEEVPRSGVRVLRQVFRCRWSDGSTHLWVGRRKLTGRGEGRSALRFDVAEPTKPKD